MEYSREHISRVPPNGPRWPFKIKGEESGGKGWIVGTSAHFREENKCITPLLLLRPEDRPAMATPSLLLLFAKIGTLAAQVKMHFPTTDNSAPPFFSRGGGPLFPPLYGNITLSSLLPSSPTSRQGSSRRKGRPPRIVRLLLILLI